MVRGNRAAGLAAAGALALCAALLAAGVCFAQADSDEKPTIKEEYVVTIDNVGDGHVVDTIQYSEGDYKEVSRVAREKRGFLTRRMEGEDNTGEMVDFKTSMDDDSHSVVLTYDMPGYVYNERGSFAVYGVDQEPKQTGERRFEYEKKSSVNGEFTLFTDQVILAKYVYELPSEASEVRYVADENAIRYEMPPATARMGFFSQSKGLLTALFGLLTLAFAAGLALVATRKVVNVAPAGGAGAAAAAAIPAPGLTAPAAPGPETGPAAPPGVPAEASAEGRAGPGYCGKCGHPVHPGKRFCSRCGAPV